EATARGESEGRDELLNQEAVPAARHRVEQIRVLVKGLQVRHEDQILGRLTVSAGLAASPDLGSTPAELLSAADEALYSAKQAGRDRVLPFTRKESAG
ncbi:MAG: diguanylate cyclase, partial [Acidobacteriota bacterium]